MALPDIKFENNVGAINFKRAMLGISDDWQWDGRSVLRSKRVSVEATVLRDPSEGLEGIVTAFNGSAGHGLRGTLTLPWTTMDNIKLESLEMAEGAWEQSVRVTAEFLDDLPQNHIYTMTFLGYTLHNPRLRLPVPAKKAVDQFAPTPLTQVGAISPGNPYYGAVRFRQGYGLMEIIFGGTLLLEDGKFPEGLLAKLAMRKGVSVDVEDLDIGGLPNGFPIVFRLHEAIPELEGNAEITDCVVQSARATWNVEKQSVGIEVSMLAQPQDWTGNGVEG
jgi:hypothetical protein